MMYRLMLEDLITVPGEFICHVLCVGTDSICNLHLQG